MKKKVIILAFLLLAVILFVAASERPARLRIINKSDQPVVFNLGYPYSYLYVAPGGDLTYTIERDLYFGSVWYCGETKNARVDLKTNVRLNFTPCTGLNQPELKKYPGEATMEKPNPSRDNKPGFRFFFQF